MVLAVIPSRFHSSRFPGKALAAIGGVPLVVRVARRVRDSGVADRVLVATDHRRIAEAVVADDFEVRLSPIPFRSGSDRVAEAAAGSPAEIVLNVQGDEPLVDAELLRGALTALGQDNDLGTVAVPLQAAGALQDTDTVKVLRDEQGRALRFSRSALPGAELAHVGIYAFRRAALARFAALPSTSGERGECLEQLRALEHGMRIGVEVLQARHASVNRPGDLERVQALLAGGRGRRTF